MESCPEENQCPEDTTEPDTDADGTTSGCEYRDCIIKIVQKLSPELGECIKSCADKIQCPDDEGKPCPDSQTQPDCSENVECEIKMNLLKITQNFNSILEKYIGLGSGEAPEPEKPSEPDLDVDSTNALNFIKKVLQKLCPELSACMEKNEDKNTSPDDQTKPCPDKPTQPECSENIDCEIKLALLELVQTFNSILLDSTEPGDEESTDPEDPSEPGDFEECEIDPDDTTSCSDYRDCIIKLAQKLCPELAESMGASGDKNSSPDSQTKPCPDKPTQPECSSNIDCEIKTSILELVQNFNTILLDSKKPSGGEGTTEPENPSKPDPNPDGNSSSDYLNCIKMLLQKLSPELAECVKTCADKTPSPDDQNKPCPDQPTEPKCSETVECKIKMNLLKLAQNFNSILEKYLGTGEGDTSDPEDPSEPEEPSEPDTDPEEPNPGSDFRESILKLVKYLCPDLAMLIETCTGEVAGNQMDSGLLPSIPGLTDETYNILRESLINLLLVVYPELAPCFETDPDDNGDCGTEPEIPDVPDPNEPTGCTSVKQCLRLLSEKLNPELFCALENCTQQCPCPQPMPCPPTCSSPCPQPCPQICPQPICDDVPIEEANQCLLTIANALRDQLDDGTEQICPCQPQAQASAFRLPSSPAAIRSPAISSALTARSIRPATPTNILAQRANLLKKPRVLRPAVSKTVRFAKTARAYKPRLPLIPKTFQTRSIRMRPTRSLLYTKLGKPVRPVISRLKTTRSLRRY
ncbi:unnamed protein product [Rodentolepis nana]|uniref:WAP domain-containing protein n=1 Tax=Rodentolepis nana TaxID=102285 RepID=A0A0R3TWQ8_RODNA|nr:unnamed protein product [Rodentolepis nana]